MIDLKISKKKKIENFIFIEVFMDESENGTATLKEGKQFLLITYTTVI